jgi:hypothetical protein
MDEVREPRNAASLARRGRVLYSMIPKSGYRFPDKIMLK